MNALHRPMTVEAYIDWSLEQTSGRFELVNGEIAPMSVKTVGHGRLKLRMANALEAAVEAAGVEAHILGDGVTVRIDPHTAFEPDALLYCGQLLDDDTIIIPEPVVVVEVLSPSTEKIDATVKLAGYFRVPSIQHYLIVDGASRSVVHHSRDADGSIRGTAVTDGSLALDPPGISVPLSDIFY